MIAPHKCPFCLVEVTGRSLEEIHEKLIVHAEEVHDLPTPTFSSDWTHSLSVSIFVRNPEEWTEAWARLSELTDEMAQKYPNVSMQSIDLRGDNEH